MKNAIIGGKVRGKIHATGRIVLEENSVFHGELKTAKLVIAEGAVFEGVCSMGQGDGNVGMPSNAKSLIGAPQKRVEGMKQK